MRKTYKNWYATRSGLKNIQTIKYVSYVVKWNNIDSGLSSIITDNKKCCCCTPERRIRLENRPEMEFLKAFLVEVSGAFTQVFSDSSFCLVSYPLFSVLQNASMNSLEVSSFTFLYVFKNQSRVWFSVKSAGRRDCE